MLGKNDVLLTSPFTLAEFTRKMQQQFLGQDMAITLLAAGLRHAYCQLQENTGPFLSLLFAGPAESGKKTAARTLAEQIFNKKEALFFISLHPFLTTTLNQLKAQRAEDKQYQQLDAIMRNTPQAIIVIENIEKAPPTLLSQFEEVLQTGYLDTGTGETCDLRRATLIFTTTLGANKTTAFSKQVALEDTETSDLMQLVFNQQTSTAKSDAFHYTAQDVCDELYSELALHLPTGILDCVQLVPFMPLDKATVEKILRLKLKALGDLLKARYGIELSYAPEIIRYLTQQALIKQDEKLGRLPLRKFLQQSLYAAIESTLVSPTPDKKPSSQLFLQLHESGQQLRCDWLTAVSRQHTS